MHIVGVKVMNVDSIFPSIYYYIKLTNDVFVTGASVHAPRKRNITYIQMIRRSIYKTRRPEYPHSPICQYERCLHGPSLRPRYMEYCPIHGHGTSTSMSVSTFTALCVAVAVTITASTVLMFQDPAHNCIIYPTLAPSSASTVPFWQTFPT